MITRYVVTSQQTNGGRCHSVHYVGLDEARAAFRAALTEGAIYAELYDMDTESTVLVEYPRLEWV